MLKINPRLEQVKWTARDDLLRRKTLRFICKELGDVSDDRRILDNDEFDLNMKIVQPRGSADRQRLVARSLQPARPHSSLGYRPPVGVR
jgi:hypothetical protein